MTDIAGKTAFITGGANGIGLAVAKSLAARGANVMLADINEEGLAAAKAGLGDMNVRVETVVCDVAKDEAVRGAAERTIDLFDKVHIVVNNAGVGLGGEAGKIEIQDWRWIVDINLMGVVHGVEAFVPHIQAHGEGGHIVNVASMAGQVAVPSMGPYNATKYAVVGYSESLRGELAPSNIGVSILCPGWVQTDIHKSSAGRPSGGVDLNSAEAQVMAEIIAGGYPADLVAEWVSDCIEANRQYIFTHADMQPAIQGRYAMIKEDYDTALAQPSFKPKEG